MKLLKCLVDNIVVDISFDTLNGLCTLAFLEVVDRHVGRAHLFKRSIILARYTAVQTWGWCMQRVHGHSRLITVSSPGTSSVWKPASRDVSCVFCHGLIGMTISVVGEFHVLVVSHHGLSICSLRRDNMVSQEPFAHSWRASQ